ncbi:LTXXQ motif family protein [Rhizobium aethiopicum]|uniref:LTXXQ motif family protein n=1 Tax=Rhizobium aethiopicum TaxID=1138170 RepID=A0A1C3Y270_9HYPH|nr:Spy/CpxP family protein refolding chaperone [Rhizobium aethiopicum]SCB58557.1 LTXXQ motif family protein [Rhizobium aethiopicum]
MKSLLVTFSFAILSTQALAEGPHHATSPYAQEAGRDIKSLSETDVDELMRGGGWGFAKPAELNRYPGPSHVLLMKDQLELTDDQLQRVRVIFDVMQARASREGMAFVETERALDAAFKSRTITESTLQDLVAKAETSRSRLRFIHLAAHLEVTQILSAEQIAAYGRHRGYSK